MTQRLDTHRESAVVAHVDRETDAPPCSARPTSARLTSARGGTANRSGDQPRPATKRLFLAAACLSTWLLFLYVGVTLAGAVHLLLVGVILARPWSLSAHRARH